MAEGEGGGLRGGAAEATPIDAEEKEACAVEEGSTVGTKSLKETFLKNLHSYPNCQSADAAAAYLPIVQYIQQQFNKVTVIDDTLRDIKDQDAFAARCRLEIVGALWEACWRPLWSGVPGYTWFPSQRDVNKEIHALNGNPPITVLLMTVKSEDFPDDDIHADVVAIVDRLKAVLQTTKTPQIDAARDVWGGIEWGATVDKGVLNAFSRRLLEPSQKVEGDTFGSLKGKVILPPSPQWVNQTKALDLIREADQRADEIGQSSAETYPPIIPMVALGYGSGKTFLLRHGYEAMCARYEKPLARTPVYLNLEYLEPRLDYSSAFRQLLLQEIFNQVEPADADTKRETWSGRNISSWNVSALIQETHQGKLQISIDEYDQITTCSPPCRTEADRIDRHDAFQRLIEKLAMDGHLVMLGGISSYGSLAGRGLLKKPQSRRGVYQMYLTLFSEADVHRLLTDKGCTDANVASKIYRATLGLPRFVQWCADYAAENAWGDCDFCSVDVSQWIIAKARNAATILNPYALCEPSARGTWRELYRLSLYQIDISPEATVPIECLYPELAQAGLLTQNFLPLSDVYRVFNVHLFASSNSSGREDTGAGREDTGAALGATALETDEPPTKRAKQAMVRVCIPPMVLHQIQRDQTNGCLGLLSVGNDNFLRRLVDKGQRMEGVAAHHIKQRWETYTQCHQHDQSLSKVLPFLEPLGIGDVQVDRTLIECCLPKATRATTSFHEEKVQACIESSKEATYPPNFFARVVRVLQRVVGSGWVMGIPVAKSSSEDLVLLSCDAKVRIGMQFKEEKDPSTRDKILTELNKMHCLSGWSNNFVYVALRVEQNLTKCGFTETHYGYTMTYQSTRILVLNTEGLESLLTKEDTRLLRAYKEDGGEAVLQRALSGYLGMPRGPATTEADLE